MKKVSTVTGKQLMNFVQGQATQPRFTVGLDLGDRHSWYCVLDEAGQVRQEQRVRTNAKALGEVFGIMPCSRIALETGTHSPWISRLLRELGHEVIVANAMQVSKPYDAFVRAGRRPHPRHWKTLAAMVGSKNL